MIHLSRLTVRAWTLLIAGMMVMGIAIVASLLLADNTADDPTNPFLVDGAEDLGWPTGNSSC